MAWKEKFNDLTRKCYKDQAIWWLNGYWENDGAAKEAETIWSVTQLFVKLDEKKGKTGNELDELMAHRFLEQMGETLTVVEMRERLRKIDIDNNKKVALSEYLLTRYNKSVESLVAAPQGSGNQKEIEAAEQRMAVVSAALEKQMAAEEKVRQAEAALQAAVDDLKAQEDAYKKQCETLEAKANDTKLGAVQKNKAANELAQLKAKDPLPLTRAKITQEAALRAVQKERKVAEAATAECQARMDEAQQALADLRQNGGVPQGQMWWLDRELAEAQKYMPKSKQR
jgi:septation ring formation regulator EzrA